MQNLIIGPSFFRNERQAYANYREAYFRELLQNASSPSIRASKIDIKIRDNEETNTSILTCKDNGSGMSLDTLKNVFLVLGESTKRGDDGEIGGKGIARNLICFSSNKYKITSHNYICEGSGASYNITESENFQRGCEFELEVEKDSWNHFLDNVLKQSNLLQDVIVNGEIYRNSLRRGRMVRELSFGEVWVNKSADNHKLIVRSGGMFMFSHSITAKAQVIVEMNPAKANECLTSNRDSLKWDYRKELDLFLNELASDTSSALRDKTRRQVIFANKGTAYKVNQNNVIKIGGYVGAEQPQPQPQSEKIAARGTTTIPCHKVEGGTYTLEAGIESGEFVATKQYKDPVLDTYICYVNTNNESIKKVIKFYDPSICELGKDRLKLLKVWTEAVDFAASIASKMYNQQIAWAPGFCFDENVLALHLASDGIHGILFNPVDNDGKIKYSINNKNDWMEFLVSASHEVAHVFESYHNENFSIIREAILTACMRDFKGFLHQVQALKD